MCCVHARLDRTANSQEDSTFITAKIPHPLDSQREQQPGHAVQEAPQLRRTQLAAAVQPIHENDGLLFDVQFGVLRADGHLHLEGVASVGLCEGVCSKDWIRLCEGVCAC